MIRKGDVCIWQNCVGPWAYLNGSETTVLTDLAYREGWHYDDTPAGRSLVYLTDTPAPDDPASPLYAEPHELRKKFPDTDDEELVTDKELETT